MTCLRYFGLALVVSLVVTACGDDGAAPVGPPASVAELSGADQIGYLGEALQDALRVAVEDADGDPVPGVEVVFAILSGAGDLSLSVAGGLSADLMVQMAEEVTDTTNTLGQASTTWTLGPTAGEQSVSATVAELDPVIFTALAKAEITDPAQDTFLTPQPPIVAPDIVRMTAWPEDGDLIIELEFVNDVVSDDVGGNNLVVGYVDIDVDQNAGTGVLPFTDDNRLDQGSTGMGSDYIVEMWMAGTGKYAIFDSLFVSVDSITPTFDANLLTLTIPLTALGGDDGIANLATVVGTFENPSDIAPNDGHLAMGPEPFAVARPAVAPAERAWRK